MNTWWRAFQGTILITLSLCSQVQAREAACHLHAPDDFPTFSKQPLIIPSVGNLSACERLNSRRFSARGRCHCTRDGIDADNALPFGSPSEPERPDQLL
ncbi:MAG: hypothetical protein KZQ80_17725 [Candidatus Thiodiazotropha sp. (ex Monitilora ramsayi)]|nr:hypothetical protein [Candidatus Thiodiazotropha sp. (ex Monitilora ramsayi)]